MPLTASGQFVPSMRGRMLNIPGFGGGQMDPGFFASPRQLPSFPGLPDSIDPGFSIQLSPEQKRRGIYNNWMNSKNAGFNGWQTLVDYNPPAADHPDMIAAQQWHDQQIAQRPQGGGAWEYAGGPTKPYQWGPFRIMPGSPFHPEGGGWGQYFGIGGNNQAAPAGPDPNLPRSGGAAPLPMPTAPMAPPAAQPPMAPLPAPGLGGYPLQAPQATARPSQFPSPFGTPPAAPPAQPASQQGYQRQYPDPIQGYHDIGVAPPPAAQVEAGMQTPGYYQGIGAPNPSGNRLGVNGYYMPGVQPRTMQGTPDQIAAGAIAQNNQFNNLDAQWAMQYPVGRQPVGAPAPQEQGLSYPAGGTTYGGGSMAITLPNGRTALVGRGIVDQATQGLPRDASAQQRHDAVLAYYTGLANTNGQLAPPSNYQQSAQTALGMRGEHVAYQGYSPEQQYNMARNRNIAQGGTGDGTYQEIMADNNRRYVAPRIAERMAMADARRQQLIEGQDLRRQAILEGQYGKPAQRRFALEHEADRQIQKQELDGAMPEVQKSVPVTTDATGNRVTDSSPNGFGTWMSNLQTTRGDKWADEAIHAIDSGKVPWNREQAIAALQAQEKDMTDFTSGTGVMLDGQKKEALRRAMERHNLLRQKLGLEPWVPRHTPPWPLSLIDPGNGTPFFE